MPNPQLTTAKRAKNDEFYTLYKDVEKELIHYHHHLKGKIVYCNADYDWSAFVRYFQDNKETIGYKELIYTHTDFRSTENINNLERADVVITNPPFSLFREYISLLVEHDKKFLVIGNNNSITYKEIFPLIQSNRMWLGVNGNKTMEFRLPDSYEKWSRIDEEGNKYGKVPAVSWFTNLKHKKRNEEIILVREYNEGDYPKYDNYDAINVDKVKDIPVDYDGVAGVPITFLNSYNPEQFEIVKFRKGDDNKDLCVNGKIPYFRILIRRKK